MIPVPDNAKYEAIVITPEDEGSVTVVAELAEVLGAPPDGSALNAEQS